MDLFKLLGVIEIDNDRAKEELDETSKKGEQTESRLKSAFSKIGGAALQVGKVIGTGMIAGAAAFGTLAIKSMNLAGELEQNMGGSEAVFGKFADNIQAKAKEAFSNMGLSTSDYLATANKMGALFQGAGFSIEESMNLSSDAMQRAADVASIMGIDTSAAMEAVAGAAKGNFTMMDNLGVAMNDTTLQAYALEKGIKKSTSEMTNQEKIGLAMELFMEKTAYAAGNYAKENETLAGSLSTAKAALTNFLDGSGDVDSLVNSFKNAATVIVGSLTEILPRLTTGLIEIVQQIIPLIPPLLQDLLPSIITGAVSLINGLISQLPSLLNMLIDSVIPQLLTGFVSIVNALVSALPQLITSLVSALPALIPQLITGLVSMIVILCSNLTSIIQPIIDYLPAIIVSIVDAILDNLPALIMGVVQLVSGLIAALPQILSALWTSLKGILGSIGSKIGEWLAPWWNSVVQWFSDLWQSISSWFSEKWAAITGFFTEMWGIVTSAFEKIKNVISIAFKLIGSIFKAAFDIITLPFRFIWENCKEYVFAAFEWIKEKIDLAISKLKEIVQKGFEIIKEKIITPIKNVYDKAVEIFNNIKSAISEKITAIKTKATEIFTAIKTKVTEIFNSIKEKITTPINNAKTAVTNAFNTVKDKISTTITNIRDKVASIFDSVKQKMTQPIEKARDTIKGIVDKIKGFFSGMNISFPHIKLPHFSIKPSGWKIGDLLEGSIPSLGISWYAKAMNNPMIMKSPTIFGYDPATGNLMGGGEAGSEIVSGTNTLMNMISTAVSKNSEVQTEKLIVVLSAVLEAILGGNDEIVKAIREGKVLKVGEREFARAVREYA